MVHHFAIFRRCDIVQPVLCLYPVYSQFDIHKYEIKNFSYDDVGGNYPDTFCRHDRRRYEKGR